MSPFAPSRTSAEGLPLHGGHRRAGLPPCGNHRRAGFTLLELVAAMALFSFIVVMVLADREKSIEMSGDARIMQTVRNLAAAKIDQIRHDPAQFDEGDQGDFEDYGSDWQDFSAYTWELEIEEVIAAGSSDEAEADYLFSEDDDEDAPVDKDGEALDPRYVRKLTFTVRFEPEGDYRPELSLKIVTFLPPEEKAEEGE